MLKEEVTGLFYCGCRRVTIVGAPVKPGIYMAIDQFIHLGGRAGVEESGVEGAMDVFFRYSTDRDPL
jgi:hypothetical protein